MGPLCEEKVLGEFCRPIAADARLRQDSGIRNCLLCLWERCLWKSQRMAKHRRTAQTASPASRSARLPGLRIGYLVGSSVGIALASYPSPKMMRVGPPVVDS